MLHVNGYGHGLPTATSLLAAALDTRERRMLPACFSSIGPGRTNVMWRHSIGPDRQTYGQAIGRILPLASKSCCGLHGLYHFLFRSSLQDASRTIILKHARTLHLCLSPVTSEIVPFHLALFTSTPCYERMSYPTGHYVEP
ncbi:hypothetical protein DOTSEDRAFT_75804 [Dothistroma septosporum NZE10]|uniref:Uncharacterized protein n=1 Tax=Dothistroma septosporum (strain NZE10 / CBS 128990) TaxID=675120 RepID=N1PD65_DOTSN|nr:hypothetical protein DOTSEDRAFT_75804 [Dothistroma septosporum NZE10]